MQTILLLDDPGLFRQLDGSLLQRANLRLLLAADGDALVSRARQDNPDLVILHDAGPGAAAGRILSGLQALPSPPSWVVLAADNEVGGQVAGSGGTVLCRPVERDALLRMIREQLGVSARQGRRVVCRLRAAVLHDGELRPGMTRDLSEGGAFVAVKRPFSEGSSVGLRLSGRGEDVELAGRVVRSVEPQPDTERLAGMAIAFDDDHLLPAGRMDSLTAVAAGTPS